MLPFIGLASKTPHPTPLQFYSSSFILFQAIERALLKLVYVEKNKALDQTSGSIFSFSFTLVALVELVSISPSMAAQ